MNTPPASLLDNKVHNTLVMAPFVEDFFTNPPEISGTHPNERFRSCVNLFSARRNEYDWNEINLPFAEREEGISKEEHVKDLFRAAFLDAKTLIAIGSAHLNDQEILTPKGRILKNSKGLLIFAKLADGQRLSLLKGFHHPTQSLIKGVDGPVVFDKPKERLKWSTPIGQWIMEHKMPGCGCPAVNVTIDRKIGKTSLIHLFWDGVVDAVYPTNC